MRVAFVVVVVGVVGVFHAGCYTELGERCDDDREKVDADVEQTDGTNNLVQDVVLDNCSEGFCISTRDGDHDPTRPYCTLACESDTECAAAAGLAADGGYVCDAPIAFGPLACFDFEDPRDEQPQHRGDSSEAPCSDAGDCDVAGESCFSAGPRVNTCGFVGRDCRTADDGGLSANPRRYCVATKGASPIAARDAAFGGGGG